DLDHYLALKETAASEEARRLTRLIVGPWSHGAPGAVVGEIDYGFRASPIFLDLREDITELHRRWFDARLKGIDTGIDAEPPVRMFVGGVNRWRGEDQWPPARAKPERWSLHGTVTPPADRLSPRQGGLSTAPPRGTEPLLFWLDPDDPVPTHGGQLLMTG